MSKLKFFAVINPVKRQGFRVVSGPHDSFAQASAAAQEINSRLSAAPFAYVRRSHTAKETALWASMAAGVQP